MDRELRRADHSEQREYQHDNRSSAATTTHRQRREITGIRESQQAGAAGRWEMFVQRQYIHGIWGNLTAAHLLPVSRVYQLARVQGQFVHQPDAAALHEDDRAKGCRRPAVNILSGQMI